MSVLGDIWDAATDNPLDTIEGILKIRGAIQGNKASEAAADDLSDLTASEIDRNNEVAALYSEGSTVMQDNLQRLLDEYGSFGQITPEIVDTLTKYFADERSKEESANIAEVDNMTEIDEIRLKGYEGAFREYANDKIAGSEDKVYGRDAIGRDNAPDSMDFARLQDSLTNKFWQMRSQNTARSLDNQYSRINARIPEGMENSTLAVQMERQFADLSSVKANEDMLAAVGDAQNYIAGLQTAASNQQNMTNAERNMERNLLDDIMNRTTQGLTNEINSGQYGQNFSSNINSLRGKAASEASAIDGMRNNTAMQDYYNGLSGVSAENKLANSYLSQVQGLSTAPYTYAAGGMNTVDTSNALESLSTSATNAAALASGNTASAGRWYNDFKSNYL